MQASTAVLQTDNQYTRARQQVLHNRSVIIVSSFIVVPQSIIFVHVCAIYFVVYDAKLFSKKNLFVLSWPLSSVAVNFSISFASTPCYYRPKCDPVSTLSV